MKMRQVGVYYLQQIGLQPSVTKLRQGNVFTCVCQSFCSRGGVSGRHPLGIHPPGRHPPAQCILGYTQPSAATAADGTHHTGMHSCLVKLLL